MSYTGSKAQTGAGTTLSIGATPTLIGEVKNIKLNGRKFDTDDVTNMSSTVKEFIATMMDPGEVSFDFNRVSSDAGQVALEAAFSAGSLSAFTIQLPKAPSQTTTGDKYAFSALVTECDYSFETTKADAGSAKLKISGTIVETIGT
jgi:hypothetical protein